MKIIQDQIKLSNYFKSLLLFGILFSGCQDDLVPEEKFYPSDYLFQQRSFPSGKIDRQAYLESLSSINQYRAKNQGLDNDWIPAGPFNISGRVTDIEVHSQDDNIIYTGSASGGVLKSLDKGMNWINIFEGMPTQAIGDMTLSSQNSDLIVVGTGESNAGGGSLAYDGLGVFASNDGGMSWRHLGLEDVGSIGKVMIDPTNDDIMYVGSMGALFENDTKRGVFKTTDGGENWDHILFISDSTGVIDMAIHPTQSDTIYAAAWERIRRPYNRQYGGVTSNIYRSFDGGESWTILAGGLPESGNRKGRIGLAIAPSSPNIVYAFYANAAGSIEGIFKSVDHGNNVGEKIN